MKINVIEFDKKNIKININEGVFSSKHYTISIGMFLDLLKDNLVDISSTC